MSQAGSVERKFVVLNLEAEVFFEPASERTYDLEFWTARVSAGSKLKRHKCRSVKRGHGP